MDLMLAGLRKLGGLGSRLVFHFINDFQNEFQKRIEAYGNCQLDNFCDFEPAFFYGEQQTKTYITPALDVVCSSNFMQEYPIDRKRPVSKEKDSTGSGKLDYWCSYGTGTPTRILLEVKQGWIHLKKNQQFTVYSWAIDRHTNAVKQLRAIKDKPTLGDYGVALTILPVFHRTKNADEAGEAIDLDCVSKVASIAMDKARADAAWGFLTSEKQSKAIYRWKNEGSIDHYENYPAVVLIWTILKLNRQ